MSSLTLPVDCRPEPYKYIKFPSPEEVALRITVQPDGEHVELSAAKPVKGIVLDVDGADAEWSDQAIDLFPGDPQLVRVKGLNGRTVRVRYLGDGSA